LRWALLRGATPAPFSRQGAQRERFLSMRRHRLDLQCSPISPKGSSWRGPLPGAPFRGRDENHGANLVSFAEKRMIWFLRTEVMLRGGGTKLYFLELRATAALALLWMFYSLRDGISRAVGPIPHHMTVRAHAVR